MPSVLLPSRISAPGSHGGAGELQAGSALLDGADVLAVGVRAGSAPEPAAERAAQAYGVDLAAVLREEKVAGRAGEVVRVPVRVDGLPPRLLLVGAGNATPEDLRRAGAALARATRGRSRVVAALESPGPAGPAAEGTRALVEGLFLGGYRVPAQGLKNRADGAPAADVQLVGTHSPQAVEQGLVHGRATWLARDLTNTPSNVKNPPWLAERAAELAEQAGLRAEIWDGQRLEAEGFGGLLAVGGGSATPPRLVRLDYRPGGDGGTGRDERPVVLVGKGITFDTGGLSIKPREAMVSMKTDMAGAAAVLAVLLGCAELGVRRPVTGLLALAENAVGSSSYRPDDVVRHYGGRTVEVANTDAEGRMVLADALAYADAVLEPDVLIDLATLTGAASLGLGRRHAALYTADDELAAGLQAAAGSSGERVWRMPLVEDYRPALDSPVADLRHVPREASKLGGGSITAALFLREFAGRRRWAHLDVAGPARADKDEHEVSKGGTGYGARLLLRWLEVAQ